MCDALLQAAVNAGLGPSREPADLLIPNWCSGKDATLNFTVGNPLQAALVQGTFLDGESEVEHTQRAKCRKYEE